MSIAYYSAQAGIAYITGLSSDTKPLNPEAGWVFLETDTNKFYCVEGGAWVLKVGPSGATGPTGPQGSQGSQGSAGTQGATGATGPQGTQGSQGSAGNDGAQGATGPTGAQGTQGSQGSASTVAGPTGATGPQGTQGSQGSASTVVGPTGATGAQGTQGSQGSAGTNGAQGATGNQGTQGSAGAQGATGPTGAQGSQGSQGSAGAGGAFTSSLGQVFVSATKSNIGNAYADIYATAFDNENLMKIDFTGVNSIRAVFMWDYVGTGTQQVRWADAADNNNVLIESATFTADQDPGDTGWVSLPAAFANATKSIEWQGKSTTAGDDPVAKGYILYAK